jgi:L-ascorbate metabolism protein UlaG (beta-lactamase superfamily)
VHLEAFPRLAAVVISHEHDDHFQVASLARLDRGIPIYLSARMSPAARRIVEEMGFTVASLRPGEVVTIGDLDVHPLGPALAPIAEYDEWDVMAFLIRDRHEDGSFFTSVDVSVTTLELEPLARFGPPSAVTLPNNFTSSHPFSAWAAPPTSAPVFTAWMREMEALQGRWGRPKVALGCGAGWSFAGALEPLNSQVFPADTAALFSAFQSSGVFPTTQFVAAQPGMTLTFRRGELVSSGRCSFIDLVDEGEWPVRRYQPRRILDTGLPPFSADPGAFGEADLERLSSQLAALAAWMVGSRPFLALNGLSVQQLAGKRPSLFLALQTDPGGEGYALEYTPNDPVFAPTEVAATACARGVACWAKDLLALFDLEINPPEFTFGHFREWWNAPAAAPFNSFAPTLWSFLHPLRMPGRYFRAYQRQLQRCEPSRCLIQAA